MEPTLYLIVHLTYNSISLTIPKYPYQYTIAKLANDETALLADNATQASLNS